MLSKFQHSNPSSAPGPGKAAAGHGGGSDAQQRHTLVWACRRTLPLRRHPDPVAASQGGTLAGEYSRCLKYGNSEEEQNHLQLCVCVCVCVCGGVSSLQPGEISIFGANGPFKETAERHQSRL